MTQFKRSKYQDSTRVEILELPDVSKDFALRTTQAGNGRLASQRQCQALITHVNGKTLEQLDCLVFIQHSKGNKILPPFQKFGRKQI